MPRIIFSHPDVDDRLAGKGHGVCIRPDGKLVVTTGANQITWGYSLNTVTYPTYAGEVVQVLSANIGDLTVGGDVTNYEMMEDVYAWFLSYMAIATQGAGAERYDEDLVTMWYPHREWMMKIRPKTLPGLHIGREVTAPTWEITAAIVQGDPKQEEVTVQGALKGFSEMHAGIGYEEYNPFSAPTKRAYSYKSVSRELEQVAEKINNVYDEIAGGDVSTLLQPFQSGKPKAQRK